MNVIDIKPDDSRTESMSKAIDLNTSQQQHFLNAVHSATRLLQNTSSLEMEEKILGNGEFFWPKDPRKPDQIIRFYRTFDIDGMWLQLKRTEKTLPWTVAIIFATPPNYPYETYQFNLSEQFLAELSFIETKLIEEPDQFPKKVQTYVSLLKSDETVKYEFSQNFNSGLLNERFPKSFFALKIQKIYAH
jgi:hypothetical protein